MRARTPVLIIAVTAVAGSALLVHRLLPTHPVTRTADRVLVTPLQVPDARTPAGGALVSGTVVDQDGTPVPGAAVGYTMADRTWSDSVTADADGRWRTERRLGPGKLVVHASSHRHLATTELIVPLDGVHPRTDVTVKVELGATITGVVVDARGAPVADADVTCPTGTPTLDGRGRFEITGVAPGEALVFATTHTQGSPVQNLQVPPGGHLEARLVLADTGIAGRVENQRGEPVAGAWVRAHSTMGDGDTVERVTDDRGRFEIDGIPAGRFELVAGRDDSQDPPNGIVVRAGDHRVALVLPDPSSIAGRVLLDGKPVDFFGVKVTAHPDHPDDGLTGPEAVHAADGRFAVSGIRPGRWSVVIVGPDFVSKIVPGVRVGAGRTTAIGDIAVARGRSVAGRVRDPRGQPVAGAQVTVSTTGLIYLEHDSVLDAIAAGDRIATTDAHGEYRVAGIATDAGPLQIGATDPQRAAPPRPLPTEATVDLALAATGEIRGLIVNERNRATIHVFDMDGHVYAGSTNDAHEFVVTRLPPGTYAVEITGTVTAAPVQATVRAGVAAQVRFDAPPVPVHLAVRTGAGQTCKEMTLAPSRASGIIGHVIGRAECQRGAAEFVDLVPGTYRVCADDKACQDVEVLSSPALQRATLAPRPR